MGLLSLFVVVLWYMYGSVFIVCGCIMVHVCVCCHCLWLYYGTCMGLFSLFVVVLWYIYESVVIVCGCIMDHKQ
jgi:hypothetical protein